jgi:diguanylate cyclase (GGDEF)-like protein/PAS domain S-box-containing protein
MSHPLPRFLTWQDLPAYTWLAQPMWVFDPVRRRKLWANPAGVALWQASTLEELLARDFSDQTDATRARTEALLEMVRRGDTPMDYFTFYPPHAPVRVEVRTTGIVAPSGELVLMFAARELNAQEMPPEVSRRIEAYRHTGALISLHRPDGGALNRNPAAIETFGPLSVPPAPGDLANQLGGADHAHRALDVLATKGRFAERLSVHTRQGLRWLDVTLRRMPDPADGRELLLFDAQDATEAHRATSRIEAENRLLSMISVGTPVLEVLDSLVRSIEALSGNMRCSMLELRDGHVHNLASPSLPDAYTSAIEGVVIGPSVGSCGTALWRGETVVVENIGTDPLWSEFSGLALAHGLQACTSVPIADSDGVLLGTFAAYFDTPRRPTPFEDELLASGRSVAAIALERARAQAAIEDGRAQLQMILDAMPMSIAYSDSDLRYRFVNSGYESLFGVPREQAVGRRVPDVLGERLFRIIRPYLERALAGEEVRWDREDLDPAGGTRHLEIHYLPHRVADGRVVGHFGIVHDISARKENERLLKYLATHDQLTGLPNRNLLVEHLGLSLARAARSGRKVAVMFIDLDRFKTVNDTLGHDAGDHLLESLAARFRDHLRKSDILGRLGGDEFGVLLDDIDDIQDAATSAQKLIDLAAEPFRIGGHEFYVTASIGIAVSPGDGTEPGVLLKNADIAMYRAKGQGKNTYQFFSAEATASTFEQLMLESALRKALERHEFVLHYQPIVNLSTGRAEAVETLLRWRHPELGVVSPARFIPMAEETGLIVPIGAWVLREACRQFATLTGVTDLRVAVNLSPRQLGSSDVVNIVREALAASGMAPGLLRLEVTESSMMQNPEAAVRTLQALRALGVTIAVDDFGTGYSSLSFLRRFPIDGLKIDQSFVRDVVDDENDAAIARAVIAMGRSLRLDIVAEGVETEAQLDFLRTEGCDKAQGYLFSRPLEFEALQAWLSEEKGHRRASGSA